MLSEPAHHFQAIHARHANIGDQHIRLHWFQRPPESSQHFQNCGSMIDAASSAFSRTQRTDASSSTIQTFSCRFAFISGLQRQAHDMNNVLPGSDSNSISPPCRLTRSCASASPSPVPPSRPGHERQKNRIFDIGRNSRTVIFDFDIEHNAVTTGADNIVRQCPRAQRNRARSDRRPRHRCAQC